MLLEFGFIEVYAGRNRAPYSPWPWLRYERFGNTRELHAFGQWCFVWTRIGPAVDDGTEPWKPDPFWSEAWADDDLCSKPEGEVMRSSTSTPDCGTWRSER